MFKQELINNQVKGLTNSSGYTTPYSNSSGYVSPTSSLGMYEQSSLEEIKKY